MEPNNASNIQDDKLDSPSNQTLNDEKNANDGSQEKTVPLSALHDERKQKKELAAKYAEASNKLKSIEEAENLKKGEYDKVINDLKSELDTLKKQIEDKSKIADKWLEYENAQRKEYKKILGDVPDFDNISLDTLKFMADKIKGKTPDVSNNIPNSKKSADKSGLTEKEYNEAMAMFPESVFTEEESIKMYKEKIKQKKENKI